MKAHAGTTSTIGTDLLRGRTKKIQRPKRQKKLDTTMTSWHNHVELLEKQSMIVRGVQSAQRWSETRTARLEELRRQVAAGAFTIDSLTLAESIVKNQTHFLDED